MKRILVIGCPGSGKSTFATRLSKKLKLPILHLDRIYHIDNFTQISRDELKQRIIDFIKENNRFIIDGNYSGTLEYRLKYADKVFYFDIPTDVCINNVIKRMNSNEPRPDMAPGFDNSIMDDDFIEYIRNFNKDMKPLNDEILAKYDLSVTKFYNYEEVEDFFKNI